MVDDRDILQGRRLLRQLLPWARAEARKMEGKVEANTPLGAATMAYVTEDNLGALMIYPAPLGGWHADLLFKQVPPGVPNSLGSPVAEPLRTRSEAEAYAKKLLVHALLIANQNGATAAKPAPVFLLFDWSLTLLPELYETALAAMPDMVDGYGSVAHAIERVEAVLADLAPDGFDGDAFNDWPRDRKTRLLAVLHMAALTGLFRYPPRRDTSPSGLAEAELSKTRH